MPNETNLRVIQRASASGPWSRVDWRYPLGLFTTAVFLRGAVTLFYWTLPNHVWTAECLAIALVLTWRLGLHALGIFPWDWDRARGSSFSLLQAVADALAFFVFMIVIFSLEKPVSPHTIEIVAAGALVYGLYCGSFAPPRPRNSSSAHGQS